MFSFARRRIGLQLALALVVASLAPLAGAAWLVSGLMERSLTRQARATQDSLLQASASLADGYVASAEAKLTTIGKMVEENKLAVPFDDPREDARSREDLARRLSALLEPSDTFLEIKYYSFLRRQEVNVANQQVEPQYRGQAQQELWDNEEQRMQNRFVKKHPDGRAVGPDEANFIPADHPAVRVPREGKPWISPALESLQGVPFLTLSVPLKIEGLVVGVLVAGVNMTPVREMLASLASQDRVLSITDGATTLASSETPPPADAFESQRRLSGRNWTVSIREPRSAALATLTEARRHALLWLALAMLLALGFTALFTSRINHPVRLLSRAAERMGQGDLAARTGLRRDDELGRLALAFDQMAESLQKLDELKSDFVSHVSHELRTPLTSIKLSIANLQDGVIGPMETRQLEVLARVRQDLDRLIRMVNELLDVARLEAGKVELAREDCDLLAIATQAAETVRPLAEAKGVRVTVEGTASHVTGDRSKLHEVILNVADNAVKFSSQGGAVTVRVGSGEVTVEDRGTGIPPEKLERIFDKFGSVPGNGDAPKPPGAGLGLSIARRIVELHGGTIRAENREGGGARFTIRLGSARG